MNLKNLLGLLLALVFSFALFAEETVNPVVKAVVNSTEYEVGDVVSVNIEVFYSFINL